MGYNPFLDQMNKYRYEYEYETKLCVPKGKIEISIGLSGRKYVIQKEGRQWEEIGGEEPWENG